MAVDESVSVEESPHDTTLLKAHKRLSMRLQTAQTTSATSPSLDTSPDMSARSSIRRHGPRAAYTLDHPFDSPPRIRTDSPLTPPLAQYELASMPGYFGSSHTTLLNAPRTEDSLTPMLQQSPPTPDTTPSRFDSLKPLMPKLSVSSQAESFRTAHSHVSTLHDIPSSIPADDAFYGDEGVRQLLSGQSKARSSSEKKQQPDNHFTEFDNFWGSDGVDDAVKEAHNGDSEDSEFTSARKRKRNSYKLSSLASRERDSVYDTPTRMTRQTVHGEDLRKTSQTSPEDSLTPRSTWHSTQLSGSDGHGSQDSRPNVVSIIRAYVVPPTPSKPRMLRHSRAQQFLRMAADSQEDISSDPDKTPTRQRNSSDISQVRMSGSSYRSFDTAKRDSLPVAQRLSSSPSDLDNDESPMTSTSLRSIVPDPPPTSDFYHPGHSRGLSESAAFAKELATKDADYPVIPQRRSSLSAPTSRNGSRAQSLTSSGRHAGHRDTQGRIFSVQKHKEILSNSLKRAAEISAVSIPHSASPEVSEAKAVDLYPHHNESVVLVDRRNTVDIARPTTPSGMASEPVLDSPLKNPRKAPKPPLLQRSLTSRSSSGKKEQPGQIHGAVYALKRTFSGKSGSFPFPTMSSVPGQVNQSTQTGQGTKEADANYVATPPLVRRVTRLHPLWKPRTANTFPQMPGRSLSTNDVTTRPALGKRHASLVEKLGLRRTNTFVTRQPSSESGASDWSHRPFTSLFFRNARSPTVSTTSLTAEEPVRPRRTATAPTKSVSRSIDTRSIDVPKPGSACLALPAVEAPSSRRASHAGPATPQQTEPAPKPLQHAATAPSRRSEAGDIPILLLHRPTEIDVNGVRRNPTVTTIEALNPVRPKTRRRSLSLMGHEIEFEFVGLSGFKEHVRDRQVQKRRASLKKRIGDPVAIDPAKPF